MIDDLDLDFTRPSPPSPIPHHVVAQTFSVGYGEMKVTIPSVPSTWDLPPIDRPDYLGPLVAWLEPQLGISLEDLYGEMAKRQQETFGELARKHARVAAAERLNGKARKAADRALKAERAEKRLGLRRSYEEAKTKLTEGLLDDLLESSAFSSQIEIERLEAEEISLLEARIYLEDQCKVWEGRGNMLANLNKHWLPREGSSR